MPAQKTVLAGARVFSLKFCPQCGAAVADATALPESPAFCSGCGQALAADTKFCPGCGKKQEARTHRQWTSSSQPPPDS